MSSTRLFWRYPSDNGTVACSTADPDYPASNLQLPHNNAAESLRDDGTSATFRVVFNLGSAYSVGAIAILGHTILATATNIKLQANTSDSWGSPAFSRTLTWADDTIVDFFTSEIYQYWSLVLTKASAAEIVQIARLVLGTYYEFPQNPSEKSVEWGGEEATRTERTASGASYSDVSAHVKTLGFRIEFMGQAQKDEIDELSRTFGLHTPFCLSLDHANMPVTGFIYGKLRDKPRFTDRIWSTTTLYDGDISMVEEL
jgi:hypothetical protein